MFRLEHRPTFPKTVTIPEAGGPGQKMRVSFRYMRREAYQARFRELSKEPVEKLLGELIDGWEVADGPDGQWQGMPEPYSAEALAKLVAAFPRAGQALLAAFTEEMFTGTPFGGLALGN